MTIDGVKLSNDMIRWFFTDPTSRYELSEVTHIAGTTKDNIQNWVKRDMIKPAGVVSGRRIYSPITVADICLATDLVEMNVTPAMAFVAGAVMNRVAMGWYAGQSWSDTDPLPPFERDIRRQYMVMSWAPSRLYPDPRRVYPTMVLEDDIGKHLAWTGAAANVVLPIGRTWVDLAATAQEVKRWRKDGEDNV